MKAEANLSVVRPAEEEAVSETTGTAAPSEAVEA